MLRNSIGGELADAPAYTRGILWAPQAIDWGLEATLLLPLPLIVIANLGVSHLWARVLTYALSAILASFTALVGLILMVLAATPALGRHGAGPLPPLVLLAAASLAGATLLPGVRRGLARFLPLDPSSPVHALALALTILLVGGQLWLQLSADVLADEASNGSPVSRLDLVAQELPLLVLALAGVGLFVRRGPAACAQRIGWTLPRWWHLALALGGAGILFGLGTGFDWLGHALTPGLAHKVDESNARLLGRLGDPAGIATIALAAGICEEALFRGALQPRLGVLWAALVFASVHTQYGLSFDTLAVFVLGTGLGLLRRFLSTTSSTLAHVAYNALAGTGVGAAGWPLAGLVGLELALLAAGAGGLLLEVRARRRALTEGLSARPGGG